MKSKMKKNRRLRAKKENIEPAEQASKKIDNE